MGGFGEDGYTGRTPEEINESYKGSIDQEYGDEVEPYQGSFAQALFMAFSVAVAENQEQDLEDLYDSLFVETAEGEELTQLVRGYGVDRQPAVAATGVVEWERNTTGEEQVIQSGTAVKTEGSNPVEYFTTESATFGSTETTVQTNIKAVEPGVRGNVGAGRVTVMPAPPANVVGVTNPNPVGDPDFNLTDGTAQTLGQAEESDSELRERVLEGASIGGAATVRAVRDKIRSLDGNPSLTIYTNRTLSDNGSGNGLPPLASELVIHTPSASEAQVAQAIHEVIAVTERQASGVNGTAVTYDITDSVLGQNRTIEWSTPIEKSLQVTIDVVTDSGYAGDNAVKEVVAQYIGGTLPDGSPVSGLDVAEDVIVDELDRRINSLDGIIGTASVTIDGNSDGTDDVTTRSDGLDAYVVADNEVATVDGTSNITVN